MMTTIRIRVSGDDLDRLQDSIRNRVGEVAEQLEQEIVDKLNADYLKAVAMSETRRVHAQMTTPIATGTLPGWHTAADVVDMDKLRELIEQILCSAMDDNKGGTVV